MMSVKLLSLNMVATILLMVSGCGDSNKDMASSDGFKPPERPKEMDQLQAFIGRWEESMEMKMAGAPEPTTSTGVREVKWANDKWFMMENMEFDMGENGKMQGISLWTWNPKCGKYRTWWFDSFGTANKGWASYDEDTKTWHFTGHGENPMNGKHTYGKGTATFTDDNTMKSTWKEWDNIFRWGKPIMEFTGTSHRK